MVYKSRGTSGGWTFLSNHAHVLVCIARDPDKPLREIADDVGITERAAHRIVTEMIEDGYLKRKKIGRRNHYTINRRARLRHPLEDHIQIGDFLGALDADPEGA
jgi:predicted transcriptional regulator